MTEFDNEKNNNVNNEEINNQNSPQNNTGSEPNTDPVSGNQTENLGNQSSFSDQKPPYLYSWDGKNQPPKKKRSNKKVFAAIVSVSLIIILLFVALSVGLSKLPEVSGTSQPSSGANINGSGNSGSKNIPDHVTTTSTVPQESDLTQLYEKIKSSCLSVVTDVSLGSGFVVREDGYIITNYHVIKGAKKISVQFYSGDKHEAKLIGGDEVSDIAVLKIEGTFTAIELGDSSAVQVGEKVVAIGTPYSIELAGTMNVGIISGIARNIKVTNDYGTVVKTMTLLQTDTSINPGNSGGPLINMLGQVIGINTMKLMDEYEGLGFAIPIKNAVTIANTLIEYGKVEERPDDDFVTATPKLNITVMNVSDARQQGSLPDNKDIPDGAFVIEAARNSAIYAAGLEVYDIITEFNGTKITSKDDLINELSKHKAGDTVTVKVYRLNRVATSGTYMDFSFKLDTAK